MIIDGKKLAGDILRKLKNDCVLLRQKGVTPTLSVILVGEDPGSASYIRQKEKAAGEIGAELVISHQPSNVSYQTIRNRINTYNHDPHIHGIIIQRPLPVHLRDPELLNSIIPSKDVDGFVPHSGYIVPVALAVKKILQKMYKIQNTKYDKDTFHTWLKSQNITIIGRGETAGTPIAKHLTTQGCRISVIHSQTPKQEKLQNIKQATIIISCVGKQETVHPDEIGKGVILISVGLSRDENGRLHGDYKEDEIKNIASFYTPTPGGVGPVNVACLMENLMISASKA